MIRQLAQWCVLFLLLLSGCTPSQKPASSSRATPTPTGTALRTHLQVVFLDVGQGDSALILFPNGKSMLIDGGPPSAGGQLVQKLRQRGIQHLDWVVATHPHSDHIGGLIRVLREFPVEAVWDSGFVYDSPVYRDFLRAVRSAKNRAGTRPKFEVVLKGKRLEPASNIHIEVLAPSKPYLTGTNSDPNNNSIVLRLDAGAVRYLFTGDIEQELRGRLYAQNAPLQAEVLKVAHHGSSTGTDRLFLQRVRPKVAVISRGQGNPYGHPHQVVLRVLRQSGATIYRTDLQGDITMYEVNRRLQVVVEKNEQAVRASAKEPTEPVQRYIGNSVTKVYHAPDCTRLPSPSRRVFFRSQQEAEQAGFRPHRECVGSEERYN